MLGQLRYEPAVAALTELWEDCPVEPIRTAAAHALFSIGTSEARDALRAGIDDYEQFDRFMAVKTMLTDEGMPWDNAGWLFSGNRLSTAAGRSCLRDHAYLGLSARQALEYADPTVTGPTPDAAAAARPVRSSSAISAETTAACGKISVWLIPSRAGSRPDDAAGAP